MVDARTWFPWLFALLFAVGACAERSAPAPAVHAVAASQHAQQAGAGALPTADRAMRITVDTSLEVVDMGAAVPAVRAAVTRAGGYLGEARVSGSDNARYASFEAHIPVGSLPAFRAEVAGLGEVTSDVEKAEDVTEQRADIKARLSNARASERRLLDLLEKQTGSLADVVAVEKELGAAREAIERMEAQERVLEGQIASATVKVHLSTRHGTGRAGPGRRIVNAARDGLHAAGAFVIGLVVVVVAAAPTLVIVILLGYAIYRVVRFLVRRSRRAPPGPA